MLYNNSQNLCKIGHCMIQVRPNVDHLALLLMPRFHSHTLTALTSTLRLTNREFGQTIFEWTYVSPSGGRVQASDNLGVETIAIDALKVQPAFICILAAYQPLAEMTSALCRWLWAQQQGHAYLMGIESGTLVLAEADLLNDHAAALHFEDEGTFRERWLDRPICNGLYNFGERVATAAGATATLDFILAFVEKRCGQMVADQVARVLLYTRRDAFGRPLDSVHRETLPTQTTLQLCRRLMLQHLENPLTIPELCQQLGIDERRLRRLFNRALGVSPARYYLRLRLTEARFMLLGTELSVTNVGVACGFANASAFARAFKAHFGFPPSQNRTPYTGLLPSPFWPQMGTTGLE